MKYSGAVSFGGEHPKYRKISGFGFSAAHISLLHSDISGVAVGVPNSNINKVLDDKNTPRNVRLGIGRINIPSYTQ